MEAYRSQRIYLDHMTCLVPEHCHSFKFCLQWSKFCYEGFAFLILTKQTTFPRAGSGLHSLRSQCRSYLRLFDWPGDPVLPFGGWGGCHIAAACLAPGKRPQRRSAWNFPSRWLHITNHLKAGVLFCFSPSENTNYWRLGLSVMMVLRHKCVLFWVHFQQWALCFKKRHLLNQRWGQTI